MNVLLAIQRRSKHDRFIFDCILYEGSLINGIIKEKCRVWFLSEKNNNDDLLKHLEINIRYKIQNRTKLKFNEIDEVTIILGQNYNGYTFLKNKE